ncbi:hypothetical protein V9T40_008420 [Parthenolecanium corni]|uniref:Ig-like domain-containing protein n=1 Tax=Parthenolecanium corni TaxID=536013 RepID=A0AAN9Y739_9HEMI
MVIFNGNFFQLGYLNVTIPPDILNDDIGFSDGHQAQEGGTIYLRCRATGEPEPEVSWKREDGKPIVIRSDKQIGNVTCEHTGSGEADNDENVWYSDLDRLEFTPPETSTKPFIIEYQPKVTNELPKIHKHHAKVTKSPQHKTSKHFVPLLNNDIMAEATSTSVSLYGKNDKNRKSQSIADDKDATRSMTPPNNGENKVKTCTENFEIVRIYDSRSVWRDAYAARRKYGYEFLVLCILSDSIMNNRN